MSDRDLTIARVALSALAASVLTACGPAPRAQSVTAAPERAAADHVPLAVAPADTASTAALQALRAVDPAQADAVVAGDAGIDMQESQASHDALRLLALRQPNFILTPHCAWGSAQAMQRLSDILIDNIDAFAT